MRQKIEQLGGRRDKEQQERVMVLPLLKLGTLALKTLSKPIASRLKAEAGKHPKFRNIIVNMAQVQIQIGFLLIVMIFGYKIQV